MTTSLSVRDLRAGYGPVEVLHGISLDAPSGQLTALLGPNGAGKTTLLNVVAGLLPPRGGQVVWDGHDLAATPTHRRARDGLLLVPGGRGVFPGLSVRDNLEVFAGARRGDVAPLAPALAAFPVLGERLDQLAGQLSGGEQQMLAISRPLLRQPRLLLLDEVSFGLAPRIARQLFDVVADLAGRGTTVVLVEQHLSDALRLADVVHVLRHGEVTFTGSPADLTAAQAQAM